MSTMLNTKLDAVNLCLSGIGRQPVPSLDTSDLDVAQAIMAIDNTQIDMMDNGGKGWWFNHEDNWKLSPDQYNGAIQVPNNVLSLVEAANASGALVTRDLAVRGSRLYDKVNHTFDLRSVGTITCAFTMFLEFDDLPVTARRFIAWNARTLFAWDVEGDPNKLEANKGMTSVAYNALLNQNTTQMRWNANMSPTMQEYRGGVEGLDFVSQARGRQ